MLTSGSGSRRAALAHHDVVGLVGVQEPVDELGSLFLDGRGLGNGEEHTRLVPQCLGVGGVGRRSNQLQGIVASVGTDGGEVVPALVEGCIVGDDGVRVVAQGSNLLVLIGVGHSTGIDQVEPVGEEILGDLVVIVTQALVVVGEQLLAVTAHPVIEQVGIDDRGGGHTVLAGLFLHRLGGGGEVVPGPVVGGNIHTGLLQNGGVVGEGDQRGGQGDADGLAADVGGVHQGLVNAGGINRAVVDVLAQVGQRAVLCVGGDVHIVHLHDVGHTAGGSVGGQLLKVAVPARGNSLEGDVGMLAGVEIEHLLRQVVAGLTAPPGDADGNRLVGAFGSGLGGGGIWSFETR